MWEGPCLVLLAEPVRSKVPHCGSISQVGGRALPWPGASAVVLKGLVPGRGWPVSPGHPCTVGAGRLLGLPVCSRRNSSFLGAWPKEEASACGESTEGPWLPLQGDMEQALENYDVCTEMLQSPAAAQAGTGSEQGVVVIRLPNLLVDSVVSLEEVRRGGRGGFLSFSRGLVGVRVGPRKMKAPRAAPLSCPGSPKATAWGGAPVAGPEWSSATAVCADPLRCSSSAAVSPDLGRADSEPHKGSAWARVRLCPVPSAATGRHAQGS